MTKEEKYQELIKVAKSVIEPSNALISNMANACAIIKQYFDHHHWVGFYLVEDNKLILGPFQGPLACTMIPHGKGVCGTAWAENKTMNIGNVHEFPGHIACSSLSNSEIVVPLAKDGTVRSILDIDSVNYSEFDELDEKFLNQFCEILVSSIY